MSQVKAITESSRAASGKVLLVDDQPELRRLFRRSLSRAGHEVVDAWNGRSAIEQAQKCRFDFVISDVRMPDMDGLQLLAALLELDPDLPVLLVSGGYEEETERLAAQGGAFGYVMKPVTFELMNAYTERAIELRRARLDGRGDFEPYASVERLRIPLLGLRAHDFRRNK